VMSVSRKKRMSAGLTWFRIADIIEPSNME
jgi:hypothetical protein